MIRFERRSKAKSMPTVDQANLPLCSLTMRRRSTGAHRRLRREGRSGRSRPLPAPSSGGGDRAGRSGRSGAGRTAPGEHQRPPRRRPIGGADLPIVDARSNGHAGRMPTGTDGQPRPHAPARADHVRADPALLGSGGDGDLKVLVSSPGTPCPRQGRLATHDPDERAR